MLVRLMVLLAIGILPISSMADNLSLRDTLQYVLDNHPGVKAEQYAAKLAYLSQQTSAGSKDWRVSSNIRYSEVKYDDGSSRSSSLDRQANLNIRKIFWSFGGDIQINQQVYKDDFETNPYFTFSSIELNIPLLHDFGGIQTRFFYEQQGFQVDISALDENEKIEELLTAIAHDFVNWASAVDSSAIANEYVTNLESLKQLYVSSNSDAKIERIRYRIDWALAESTKTKSFRDSVSIFTSNQLIEFTNIDRNKLSKPNLILSSTENVSNSIAPDSILLDKLRILQMLTIGSAKSNHAIKANQNLQKPFLELSLEVEHFSTGENYSDSLDNDDETLHSRLNFNYPIGNTRANAQLNISQLQNNFIRDDSLNQQLRLKSSIKSLYRQLIELKKTIALATKEVQLAEQGINQELDALKAAKIDISIYLTALQHVFQQKQAFITNATLFQHLYINYLSVVDKLWNGDKLAEAI